MTSSHPTFGDALKAQISALKAQISALKAQISSLELDKAELTKVNLELREKLVKTRRVIHIDSRRDQPREDPFLPPDPESPPL